MGYDGSGNYTRQRNFSADASAGIRILASAMDQEVDDVASAFNQVLLRDGRAAATGNIPMGGNRLVNVGAPTAVNEYMRSRDFIENVPIFMTDTNTATDTVSVSASFFTSVSAAQAPRDGTKAMIRMASHKTSAPIMRFSGHSANIHFGGGGVVDGFVSGAIYELVYASAEGVWETYSDRLIPRTAAEISAGVTPTNYQYEPGNVLRYGTNTTPGTTDMTASIQAAIDAAQTFGGAVFVPAGNYLISSQLVISKQIRFYGEGIRSVLIVAAGVGAGVDIIKISPSASDDTQSGFVFEDFRISPASGTPGRHAIAIDITTRGAYSIKMMRLRLDALGGRGIVTLPNATPLLDGYFTSEIEQCTIYNGIYLDKAGDSIRIINNTITGSNVAIYADLVFESVSNKAHGLDIIGNNITASGGSVHIKSAWAARIERNIFESASGNSNNAIVDIDGTDATNITTGLLIGHNIFNTPSGVDAVRVNFARLTQIFANHINEPGGGGFNYKITSNAVDTNILFNPTSGDTSIAAQLSDAGTRTLFMRHGIAGYMEVSRPLANITANGSSLNLQSASTTVTAAAGATISATNLIPAKALVYGVTTRITTSLGTGSGTTGYTVGDGSDADRWGVEVSTAAGGTTDNSDATADPSGWFNAATSIVLTATGGNFDGTGVIRVTVFYHDTTAPVS